MASSSYAGEAEEHFAAFLQDIHGGTPKPIYNHMHDLPNLQEQTIPYLPRRLVQRYDGVLSSFDAGRGCPFQCSFCTIINVQGRKSRYRSADDIERIVRQNAAQNISRFFITDDNFARNKNWEAIFDRLIELRENGGQDQFPHSGGHARAQDSAIHRKGRSRRLPIRLHWAREHQSRQSRSDEEEPKPDHRIPQDVPGVETCRAWSPTPATFSAFPATRRPASARDIEIVQKELPVDLLEFTMLTPLPGSEDHQKLHEQRRLDGPGPQQI